MMLKHLLFFACVCIYMVPASLWVLYCHPSGIAVIVFWGLPQLCFAVLEILIFQR